MEYIKEVHDIYYIYVMEPVYGHDKSVCQSQNYGILRTLYNNKYYLKSFLCMGMFALLTDFFLSD